MTQQECILMYTVDDSVIDDCIYLAIKQSKAFIRNISKNITLLLYVKCFVDAIY
jgi:hypothetical protein